ncbi:MAG: rod shape-determining protein MreD [Candidatus Hydrogenedens sp.]|nr:rod shape-determining protein MreD [Candidatus Hydrogenedentota bacterium]NLF58371.1 rod shape-determining protein MreD [Candidatus Hydrogenedens sp.]
MRWRGNRLAVNLWWLAGVVFLALVQTNWPDALKFQEVLPDLVLVMVVYFAIAEGEERAMLTGLVGGLYQDVAVNTVMGHHVLCHVLVGFAAGRLATRLVTGHAAVKAGLVLSAALSQGVLFTLIQYVQQPQRGMLYPLVTAVVPSAFYTALVAPLVFVLLDLLMGRRETPGGVMV